MALPELTQKLVETTLAAYCAKKVPSRLRFERRLTFSVMANTVTVFDERHILSPLDKWAQKPIAQFRLNAVDKLWRLYYARSTGWVLYPDSEPSPDFEVLLTALDQDASGVFCDSEAACA